MRTSRGPAGDTLAEANRGAIQLARHNNYSEIPMKSMLKLASATLLLVSGAAFATGQATAPATAKTTTVHSTTTTAPAATTTMPAATTTTTTTGNMTHAQYKAAKKQIEADEKTAKAACKKMKGAEASACKKDAEAKEETAMADLKARK